MLWYLDFEQGAKKHFNPRVHLLCMPPKYFKLSPFSQTHLRQVYKLFSRRHFGKNVIPFQKFVEVYDLLNRPGSSFLDTSKRAQIGRQIVRTVASHLRINPKRKVAAATSKTHLDRQWPDNVVSEYFIFMYKRGLNIS